MEPFSIIPFISALPLPTVVIGSDNYIELANPQALELLGQQIIQHHFVSALRQPNLVAEIEKAQITLEKRTGQYSTTDGRRDVIYAVNIAPAGDRLVLTFIDTSEAQDLDLFRRDFVANVSHELRTPLASVIGFIETLRGPAKNDAAAHDKFLGIMESEARRMSRLVDDLLSLSRVEENERKRPTVIMALGNLTAQTIAELKPIIDEAKASVSMDDQSGGCSVLADAGQLRQVIGNLVENALRYGARHGNVSIAICKPAYETRLRQNGVRLSVSDEGQGIAAHHLPRLAERFYRVDSHRSREIGGTGLGLAIVKHIVQRHRGHLLIESCVGKGSTFTVILPVSEE